MSRQRIQDLVTKPHADLHPDLRDVEPSDLLACLLDRSEPWWRRQTIARLWCDGAPEAYVGPMIELVMDATDVTEVRVAVLDAVCPVCDGDDSARLVQWLRDHRNAGAYGLAPRLLLGRAALGDLSAADELVDLADDPWSHLRALGVQGLERLDERFGHTQVLQALGYESDAQMAATGARPALRMLGIWEVEEAGGDVLPFLADPETRVARYVYDQLVRTSPDPAKLAALTEAPDVSTRCWAHALRVQQGEGVDAARAFMASVRIEVPGLGPKARAALLATHAPGERNTDPRWVLESVLLDHPEPRWDHDAPSPETAATLERLKDALARRGIETEAPLSSGAAMQQGSGTYFVLRHALGAVLVSTLGPFATEREDVDADRKEGAEEVGLQWIDRTLAGTVVPGLCVYFFGRREPLTVHDLLFYWQD